MLETVVSGVLVDQKAPDNFSYAYSSGRASHSKFSFSIIKENDPAHRRGAIATVAAICS